MNIPDHDELVGFIQSKVRESMAKIPRAEIRKRVPDYGLSYGTYYNIARWVPESGISFSLRLLLNAYQCAYDIEALTNNQKTTTSHGVHR